jgi:hypothetical protein
MSKKKQKQNKSEKEVRKSRAITNQIKKRRKCNKTLSKKSEKVREFFLTKYNKRKELKINVLSHELLAFTLSYLMLTP